MKKMFRTVVSKDDLRILKKLLKFPKYSKYSIKLRIHLELKKQNKNQKNQESSKKSRFQTSLINGR